MFRDRKGKVVEAEARMTTEKATPLGRLLDSRSLMAAMNEYAALREVEKAARKLANDFNDGRSPHYLNVMALQAALAALDEMRKPR